MAPSAWNRFVWIGIATWVAVGCQPEPMVTFTTPHPWHVPLDDDVALLAVYPFAAARGTDPRWARQTTKHLGETLDQRDPRYPWSRVVGPDQLKALAAGLAIDATPGRAAPACRLASEARAPVLITGVVHIEGSPSRASADPAMYTAAVAVRLLEAATGDRLAYRLIVRRYVTEDGRPPPPHTVAALIDQCTREVASMLALYETRVTIPLLPARTERVAVANRIGAAGSYSEALALYELTLTRDGADDQVMYNAGVMCEAAGRLDRALAYYDRALRRRQRPLYLEAYDRVRLRLQAVEGPSSGVVPAGRPGRRVRDGRSGGR
ncbi:MAG: hypothetical protein ACOC95_04120 [Planctomycetota bacterium]